jgi:hypothetical protein
MFFSVPIRELSLGGWDAILMGRPRPIDLRLPCTPWLDYKYIRLQKGESDREALRRA